MSKYDVLVIGPVSLDCNIDYQDNVRKEVGGAVVASGFAAAKSENKTAVFTKFNKLIQIIAFEWLLEKFYIVF